MAVQKILMLVSDYVEDYEVMVPFQALQMVGHTVGWTYCKSCMDSRLINSWMSENT